MSFPRSSLPTSGCSFVPTAAVGSSEPLWPFVSESVPDITAGPLSSLCSESPMMGAPGLGFLGTVCSFFFATTGSFFKGPGTNFLRPGTTLVVL